MKYTRKSIQPSPESSAQFASPSDSLTGVRRVVGAYRPTFVFGFILIALAVLSVVCALQAIDEVSPVDALVNGEIVGQVTSLSATVDTLSVVASTAATAVVEADYQQAFYFLVGAIALITVISVAVVAYLNLSLVRTKRQLQNQNTDLRTTNIVKERFLTSASHELNTPITVATALTDVLSKNRNGNLTERQLSQLAAVQRNNKRLSEIVDSMIRTSASGIYQGMTSETVVYSEFLESSLENIRAEVEIQGVRIESSIPDYDDRVDIDRARVEQAIGSLLINAVQHSSEGSTVYLRVEKIKNAIRTSVRDSGTGIAEQDRAHVFSPFYRSDSEHTRRLRGLGLGLTMVKRIIESHGGEVGFESNPGNAGVTFHFTLPTVD